MFLQLPPHYDANGLCNRKPWPAHTVSGASVKHKNKHKKWNLFKYLSFTRGQCLWVTITGKATLLSAYNECVDEMAQAETLSDVQYSLLARHDFCSMFQTKQVVSKRNKNGTAKLKSGVRKGISTKTEYYPAGFARAWESYEKWKGTWEMLDPFLDAAEVVVFSEDDCAMLNYMKGQERLEYIQWAADMILGHLRTLRRMNIHIDFLIFTLIYI